MQLTVSSCLGPDTTADNHKGKRLELVNDDFANIMVCRFSATLPATWVMLVGQEKGPWEEKEV